MSMVTIKQNMANFEHVFDKHYIGSLKCTKYASSIGFTFNSHGNKAIVGINQHGRMCSFILGNEKEEHECINWLETYIKIVCNATKIELIGDRETVII